MRTLPRLVVFKRVLMLGSALGSLAFLPACSSYSLEELRHAQPKGTPYQASLALEYLRFAEDEARNVDWADAGYFSEKGLQAAYGHDVAPENPADWSVAMADEAALEQARTELTSLTPEQINAQPQVAARAQLDYDCWVMGSHGGWSEDRLADCRDGFRSAIQTLTPPPAPPAPPPPPPENPNAAQQAVPVAEVTEEKPEKAPQEAAYIIFFATNRAALDAASAATVEQIVADIKKEQKDPNYVIVLNGHTDTTGAADYNFKLSLKRAEAVKAALIKRGIPEKSIRTFGFGETDLKVKTPNNTPEPKNRRVEIFLGD